MVPYILPQFLLLPLISQFKKEKKKNCQESVWQVFLVRVKTDEGQSEVIDLRSTQK
jgi:hypothetical protein